MRTTTFWNWHKMVRYCDLADLAEFHDRKMLRENGEWIAADHGSEFLTEATAH